MGSEIQQIFVTNGRDWLGLIVECAVPVIIMIITLIVSRIQQNRALRQQAKESKQQLEQQAKEHAQEMLVQKDVLRLSIMPVFDVVSITGEYDSPEYLKNSPKKNHILKIVLKNVGSGNALGLVTLLSPCNDDIVFGFVDRSDTAIYRCYKDFEYDNAIATIGKEVSVYIIRDKRGVSIPTEDIFVLPLRFMDMIGTCYEQRIAVQILINEKDGSVEPCTIKPDIPRVILTDSSNDKK